MFAFWGESEASPSTNFVGVGDAGGTLAAAPAGCPSADPAPLAGWPPAGGAAPAPAQAASKQAATRAPNGQPHQLCRATARLLIAPRALRKIGPEPRLTTDLHRHSYCLALAGRKRRSTRSRGSSAADAPRALRTSSITACSPSSVGRLSAGIPASAQSSVCSAIARDGAGA